VTLILMRRDIRALMETKDWREAVEQGFRASAKGAAVSPLPLHVEGEDGGFHAKAAILRGDRPYVALKLNGNFPANPSIRGLPTIQGAILLCDGKDGRLLAIMDSIEVTLRRTAAATALAAIHLARPESSSLLVCGCGEQSRAQIEAVRDVLPIERIKVWDKDLDKALALAREDKRAEAVTNFAEAARASDVIVTCTSATEPFLDQEHVSAGTFIAAVGADSAAKCEIAPALMARVRVVADSVEQCATMGDLRHAIAAGAMRRDDVHGELAQLVVGNRPGRTRAEETMLFDSTGTALQDVASAACLYERALKREGLLRIDLAA
jgi:alanine dehydrogenase